MQTYTLILWYRYKVCLFQKRWSWYGVDCIKDRLYAITVRYHIGKWRIKKMILCVAKSRFNSYICFTYVKLCFLLCMLTLKDYTQYNFQCTYNVVPPTFQSLSRLPPLSGSIKKLVPHSTIHSYWSASSSRQEAILSNFLI